MSRKKQVPKPYFPESDQGFDDRALHLQKNIYGSDKGKLRLKVLQRDLQPYLSDTKPITVLDAGCGAGLMSEWVASQGHIVSACDSAAVMVDETRKRLQPYPLTCVQQATVQDLSSDRQYHMVMCHAVLEWVEDQGQFLQKLCDLVVEGGYLSLMFYNSWAREMAQMVYGNFSYIDKDYQVRQRVKLSPHRPADPHVVEQQLQQRGFKPVVRSGIRVFYDIMRDQNHYQTLSEDIIRHELRVSQQYPYWQMGRYIHYLCKCEI